METKRRGPRRKFTEEFKREAVRLVETGERTVWRVAADLGIAPKSLRTWVAQARADKGPQGALTTEERAELTALRKENRQPTANRTGILATISNTFSTQGINISEANCRAGDDGRAQIGRRSQLELTKRA